MKILLVGAASSIHMVRWANGLVARGHQIHLASVHPAGVHDFDPGVQLHFGAIEGRTGYLLNALWLHRLTRSVAPDLVNVHYATGYGLLARLARLPRPVLLSVWGSDVYDSPRRNWLARRMVRQNLAAATRLASTSHAMAAETRQYAPGREISITPFGVDTDVFAPAPRSPDGVVRVGTVKALSAKYGIAELIDAFDQVCEARPDRALHLDLYGSGPDEAQLRVRAAATKRAVTFHGLVPHDRVPSALASLDIFAALSTLSSESFGVAIIEAGACGLPVVVSDADGPAEVVAHGRTGFVVPRGDVSAAAHALGQLVDDAGLRSRMGTAGRQHVLAQYSWAMSLKLMEQAYHETLSEAAGSTRLYPGASDRAGLP